jgi:primary-amine oxidase
MSHSMRTHRHPLEPLSADEVQTAVALLKSLGKVTPTTRFVSVALKEPPKQLVHSFTGAESLPRLAAVSLFDNGANCAHEATLSLTDNRLLSWQTVEGVQATMTFDEQIECEQAVRANPAFRAALKKHYGVENTDLVMVDIWSAGYYGEAEEEGKRLARPICFLRSDPTDNGYARPIEGIRPVVDLNTMTVLRVEEHGEWPLPKASSNYDAARQKNPRTDIKPLDITQPQGPTFAVDGNVVRWQKWSFVIGFNSREGLTLHHLRYNDAGKDRSILYRASLTEMVVPYGDPSPTQRRKNAFDVGEYGMGMCANSLELGCDCLGEIRYFDAHLCDSCGGPLTIKNAICMHEEDFGILWKHTDRRLGTPEVRRSRRLVISSVSTVENYEYGFFWYLYQDGNIGFEIKLTGILSLGVLPSSQPAKYGAMVAPLVYAPNHQHFFNVRLDFDLDGVANSVYRVDVLPDEPGPANPFGNAFAARPMLLETEKAARSHLDLRTSRTWKVVNPNVKNALGEPVGYRLMPGDNAFPFASPDAWWRKRAGFVNYHVWVTPYREGERYAAGDYPNQSHGGEGLVAWTEQDRSITDTDIVLWYTFAHTHIPRPEDYPVMPTAYVGFLLKPSGFFSENPALDVPPSPKKGGCCHS